MKYSIRSVTRNTFDDSLDAIGRQNFISHANKRNSSPVYQSGKVIDFLAKDSEEFDDIVESVIDVDD